MNPQGFTARELVELRTIRKGDFIQAGRTLRDPRGFVVSTGEVAGQKAFKIRKAQHGHIALILASDAQLVAKTNEFWERLSKRRDKAFRPSRRRL